MMNIGKIINIAIFYMIRLFGILIFMIGILLVLYYITPNNYLLVLAEEKKFKLINKIELNIPANSKIYFEHNNNYLQIDKEIVLIVKNALKSQKIILEPKLNQYIKIDENSKMIILNESESNCKFLIGIFEYSN